jgi:1,4-alpha-glucan branching enzyme
MEKQQPLLVRSQLVGQSNQLKALIDVCHLFNIAVLIDVVYNHAGGEFGDQSLYFFDRATPGDNNNSLYFTDQGHAGGLIFAYWNKDVCQFLINNAKFFLEEYHVDGFRYDRADIIDHHGGGKFCQDLTNTLRFLNPGVPHVAEYWEGVRSVAVTSPPAGLGFDAAWQDVLRDAIRGVIAQAAHGRDARVDFDGLANVLRRPPDNFGQAWKAVHYLENHDYVRVNGDRQPRIPALADATNARSWYARSRARVATGLLLTAPGIPLLFMGQEILEDKLWSDNPSAFGNTLIWLDGLKTDEAMRGHLHFTRDLVWLRRRHPALRGEPINVFQGDWFHRVFAFQRWIENAGRDVVVVASLNESTLYDYALGFPQPGQWFEVFNSDFYDNDNNPIVAGNGGQIIANGRGQHGLPHSAIIVIPANAILVFARDRGD